jgi:hypothetical protein
MRRSLCLLERYRASWKIRLPQDGDVGELGHGLPQKLQPFATDFWEHEGQPRDVPTWPREAGDEAIPHRITTDRHDDGDRCGGVLGRTDRCRPVDHHAVHLKTDQVRPELGEPVTLPFGKAVTRW